MNYSLLIILPLISGFIGWIASRMLITLLFHPRQPRKILGINLQGIFPRRQQEIAKTLGKLGGELLPLNSIDQKISNPETLKNIMPLIENHIDDFLRNRLGKEMPMIAMFIGDKTIDKLKEAFMKEIELLFPVVMKQYASAIKEEIDIEQLIFKKIAGFSSENLEKVFYHNMSKELRLIGLTGAVLGILIGVVQVIIIQLIA